MAKVNLTPEPGTPCQYSARHQAENVQAVAVVDMQPVGDIPCCQACVDLYQRLSGR
jgi:hypothetical protein